MTRKRTSAKATGVQMWLEPLDGRVLPDAKVDLDVAGAAATVQSADVNAEPQGDKSEGLNNDGSDSALYGAALAKNSEHPAEYQAMLDEEVFGAFTQQFMVLEFSSVSGSAAYYVAELGIRSEIARGPEMGIIEEASAVLTEVVRTHESAGEKVLEGTAASANTASLTLARADIDVKTASVDPRHSSNELNAANLGAASESQTSSNARVDGQHTVTLLIPSRVENPPVLLPTPKDLLVVPPIGSGFASVEPRENAAVQPAIPVDVSVVDPEESEPASHAQTEESPGFASQAADLIAHYTPFDSVTVNENIERFLNNLRESHLPQSTGWNVWKVAVISTAGTMSALSAEFIRRKRLLTRVPVIRNLSQRLTRTKMA